MTLTTEWLKERLKNPRTGTEFELISEVLANREAQPVAYLKKTIIDSERFDSVDPEIILYPNRPEGWHSAYQAVFAAPPAPAVPEEIAPTYEAIQAILPTANPDDYACCVGADMWNACRAAMLAQPVSQRYKLPDNVREALTLALHAMEFMGDTLNSVNAVCTEDVEYVTPAFTAIRGLLAAAPEGGN